MIEPPIVKLPCTDREWDYFSFRNPFFKTLVVKKYQPVDIVEPDKLANYCQLISNQWVICNSQTRSFQILTTKIPRHYHQPIADQFKDKGLRLKVGKLGKNSVLFCEIK